MLTVWLKFKSSFSHLDLFLIIKTKVLVLSGYSVNWTERDEPSWAFFSCPIFFTSLPHSTCCLGLYTIIAGTPPLVKSCRWYCYKVQCCCSSVLLPLQEGHMNLGYVPFHSERNFSTAVFPLRRLRWRPHFLKFKVMHLNGNKYLQKNPDVSWKFTKWLFPTELAGPGSFMSLFQLKCFAS